MRRRLLDLFCGAGGASKGYADAGFDVVGVDKHPQPHYPFEFIQADALEFLAAHGSEYVAIHASPPCQVHSALKHLPNFNEDEHEDLVAETRSLLEASGAPWIMENVPGAPLRDPVVLCGSMFRLATPCGAELRRHRLFELSWPKDFLVPMCDHGWSSRERTPLAVCGTGNPVGGKRRPGGLVIGVHGHHPVDSGVRAPTTIGVHGDHPRRGDAVSGRRKLRTVSVTGSTPQQNVERNSLRECFSVADARVAMGIDWMPMKSLSQAIPPAYTRWLGEHLADYLNWISQSYLNWMSQSR